MAPKGKVLTVLPLVAAALGNGEPPRKRQRAPGPLYTQEECDGWLETMVASDADSSGGLSASEFYDMLSGIEEPQYVQEYFKNYGSFGELPWGFRIVHKSLACHCEQLGKGPGCCEGDEAELLVDGTWGGSGPGGADAAISKERSAEVEYADLVCQQLAFLMSNSIPTPEPTGAPSGRPSSSPVSNTPSVSPTQSPAAATNAPTNAPTVQPTSSPTQSPEAAPSAQASVTQSPTTQTPVAQAPTTIAPTLTPNVVYRCADLAVCNYEAPGAGDGWDLGTACGGPGCPPPWNENAQYITGDVVTVSPGDVVNPGESVGAPDASTGPEEGSEGGGMSAGAVAGIVIAILILAVALMALIVYRRRMEEERRLKEFAGDELPDEDLEEPSPPPPPARVLPPTPQVADLPPQLVVDLAAAPPRPGEDDDESSAPSVWSESRDGGTISSLVSDGEETPAATPGSALAAIGASGVAAGLMGGSPSQLV